MTGTDTDTPSPPDRHSIALIYAAFIAGLCSIIYELLIATTASYFLGDSVTYFSLTIGLYMSAMGLGSFVSKYVEEALLRRFILAELALGVAGGLSIPVLYLAYGYSDAFIPVYVVFTLLIGFLIGLEIPFLTRLMERYQRLRTNIANILSLDYIGALIATIAFPFILLPFFGVYQSSLIFGLVNLSLALVVLAVFRDELGITQARRLQGITIVLSLMLVAMILAAGSMLRHWDSQLYQDRVVYSKRTPHQQIVLTKYRDDIRLYLNGNLQFSSIDEYRYHEALVHVPVSLMDKPPQRVLLLGAGDGLAVRELLAYEAVQDIVVVELDPAIPELGRNNPHLLRLNEDSLASPKVTVVTEDAFRYVRESGQRFDLIIADLPDPNSASLSRLYSKQFYRLIASRLSPHGLVVTQATSPYFATDAFWAIKATMEAAPFAHVYPYHLSVPSFGEWGFVLASPTRELPISEHRLRVATRFLGDEQFASLFDFPPDMRPDQPLAVNTLDRPTLLNHYLDGWRYYAQ